MVDLLCRFVRHMRQQNENENTRIKRNTQVLKTKACALKTDRIYLIFIDFGCPVYTSRTNKQHAR